MNQKGYSWPEAILALSVLLVVFGTLLPLGTKMTSKLSDKKLAMYAAEALYHGAILHTNYGIIDGVRQIDGYDFEWVINSDSSCVLYKIDERAATKCIHF